MKPSTRIEEIATELESSKIRNGQFGRTIHSQAIEIYLQEQYEKEPSEKHNCLENTSYLTRCCNVCEKSIDDLYKPHDEPVVKNPCKYCGTFYQDPTYCSVSGRTADKHVFEGERIVEEKCNCGGDLVDDGRFHVRDCNLVKKFQKIIPKVQDKHVFDEKPLMECPCYANGRTCDRHLERDCPGKLQVFPVKKEEPVSERNEEEVLEKLERSLPEESVSEKLVRKDRKKLEDVSERNALIDELVQELEREPMMSGGYTTADAKAFWDGKSFAYSEVVKLLKSKKK